VPPERLVRPYVVADRDRCLAIFDSNAPPFFDPSERNDLAAFLDRYANRYFVVEEAGSIVACGGWGWREEPRVALLCWGMVHRDHHRRGIGTLLLSYRLAEIARGDFDEIEIVTSQHSKSFFVRAGFIELAMQTNLFAPGLHSHRMRSIVPRK
jgi:GNAT superfamily N-acetyltransferase